MNTLSAFCRRARVIIFLAPCCAEFAAAAAIAVAQPAPEILLSLRGVSNRSIQVGEPLFVAVRIELDAKDAPPLELAPGAGAWVDAVDVVLSGGGSSATKVSAKPTSRPENSAAKLSAEEPAAGLWLIGSAVSAQLAPGDYQVQARLVIRDGRGWKGEAESDLIALRIVAATSTPERILQSTLARAQEAALADAPQEAARLIDTLLSNDPDNLRLLMARAALCLRGGDDRSARACVNRALGKAERERLKHPPIGLVELDEQIAVAQLKSRATDAAPPAWTRLPASVLTELPRSSPNSDTTAKSSIPSSMGMPGNVSATPSTVRPTVPVAISSPAVEPVKKPASVTAATPSVAVPAPATPPGVGGNQALVPTGELVDAKIIADPNGQWAAGATAGTQYGRTQYSAEQATGAPNVPIVGNSPDAWCPAVRDTGMDWLELTFAKPIQSAGVRVRQSDASGAIVKVEAFAPDGTAHVWWEGVDPQQRATAREIVWFAVQVPKTSYPVARVKLTLNLASGPGYKQIDAVQLVGADGK